jgi:hypothetical protein
MDPRRATDNDPNRDRDRHHDCGQAAVLVVVTATAVFTILATAVVGFGGRLVDRVRAQTVADAAALASLDGGRAAAEAITARHDAVVVSWQGSGGTVTVVVTVRSEAATARASDEPSSHEP